MKTKIMCAISRVTTSHDITHRYPLGMSKSGKRRLAIARERKGQIFWCFASEIAPNRKRKHQSPGEDNFHLCLIIEHPTTHSGSSDTHLIQHP